MIAVQQVVRAFGLALVGTMHPRMLWLSLRPFFIISVFWGCLIWLTWTPSLAMLSSFLTNSIFTNWIQDGLIWAGFDNARAWIAPFFFVMMIIPLIAISLLVLIAFTTVPAIVNSLCKQSLYSDLQSKRGGSLIGSLFYTFWSAFICLVLVMLTLPVWWIPPLFAILPPLFWGWLTMRLMSYDVLAGHASSEERDILIQQNRWSLLVMGIACGMLGAVPTFFWATSALALVLFPIVSFVALWIYSLIFVFAGLWFSHFLLEALQNLRKDELSKSLLVETRVIDSGER
ncbi:EI24 domain-containing protein [Polynucleobacter paneuropaeus]|uniref:EI24 domain-containing protein n=1 Tax=Polynucleobacter paneuropaeus TaxID=2527775 RepID=A0A9Q2WH42_9BURK|nr:EI24 domain-containing protein [Polynucleobacter paneuropaeus]MBT8636969.1 EI24 domain-containing protein [Polynucleobacter paneuropaeus]MBT8638905.1 EI24 domain-containing protein [Polynucleobacter paneuropaeus]